jgi:hypothetical protein
VNEETELKWAWNGTLADDEWFDVRMWQLGQPHLGITWTKDRSHLFDPASKASGVYYWSVAVILGRNGTWLANLSLEAPHRSISIPGGGGYGGVLDLPAGMDEEQPAARPSRNARAYSAWLAFALLSAMGGLWAHSASVRSRLRPRQTMAPGHTSHSSLKTQNHKKPTISG